MKKRIAGILVLLFGICAGVWWGYEKKGESGELLTVYGNVDIRQVETGFRIGGRIAEMRVEEGKEVREGELIARLDPVPEQEGLRQAEAELAMQEAELKKMHKGYRAEDVAQARATYNSAAGALVNANSNLHRIKNLRRQKAVAQKDLDEAEAGHIAALSQRNAAREQLRLMESGYRIEDINRQEAAVQAAQAGVASARTRLGDTELYAPQDGVVLTRVRETGAVVQGGQTVYAITLRHPTWIRAYISQPNLGNIRPGQEVLLSIDATPGKTYPGTIGFISPTAEFTPKSVETKEVRSDLVFRFRIITEDPENVLRQGMPVTITLRKGGGKP